MILIITLIAFHAAAYASLHLVIMDISLILDQMFVIASKNTAPALLVFTLIPKAKNVNACLIYVLQIILGTLNPVNVNAVPNNAKPMNSGNLLNANAVATIKSQLTIPNTSI